MLRAKRALPYLVILGRILGIESTGDSKAHQHMWWGIAHKYGMFENNVRVLSYDKVEQRKDRGAHA